MLFNSYEFMFAFLPVVVAGFLLAGKISRSAAIFWLIAASLVFYASWRPLNLVILAASIAVNLIFAGALLRLARAPEAALLRNATLALGVISNVLFLGYFKYALFVTSALNSATGTRFEIGDIILPLGISFITFQKIAFLVDVWGGRVRAFTVRDFLLFVTYFPQLVAGPIVHYRESIPQFQKISARFDAPLFSAGVTLFIFGLFKKTVLADGVALHISPIYDFAAAGGVITLLQAWLAAIGFTFQIYFDFSGYSDMASGISLLFGVKLPINFNSPLKAVSIIDFWARWHMTLTRFLTAYIYNPLALSLMRRRAAKGLASPAGRNSELGAFFSVLAAPTLLTMLVSGIWHGAAYTFIAWGLLHGLYLVINHFWRQYGFRASGALRRLTDAMGFVLTFVAVTAAMVLFRAPSLSGAGEILLGLSGANGVSLPPTIAASLHMGEVAPMMLANGPVGSRALLEAFAWTGALAAIALLAPNTAQILSRYQPLLYGPERSARLAWVLPEIYWRPSLLWAIVIAVAAAFAVIGVTANSEFLYWQF